MPLGIYIAIYIYLRAKLYYELCAMASRCNTLFKQLIQEAVDRVKECRVQTRGRFDNHVEEKPPVPIALWPSVFPRKHYEFLLRVQKDSYEKHAIELRI